MNNYNIKFTRHSKKRMKLYNITEDVVKRIVDTYEAQETDDGKIIYIGPVNSFAYPIKIICKVANDEIIVISCYPLKRRN